jgi:uncharacterized protein
MAKYLRLGPQDNVVTIATDGFDRYESVIQDLQHRVLETEDHVLNRWYKDIFLKADTNDIEDARADSVKERLFKQKEKDWLKFGYKIEYLNQMRKMDFWDNAYEKIHEYDKKIIEKRGKNV